MVTNEFLTPNGIYHFTSTTNGTTSVVPADPTLLSFTGTFAGSFHENGPANVPGGEYTNVLNVSGHFSDGTPGTLHQLEHLTINANGDVTVFFSNMGCNS
jgi:hypothetical protein